MNDRFYSFLDMVFILVFPLGYMGTSTADVLLIFVLFAFTSFEKSSLFSFP